MTAQEQVVSVRLFLFSGRPDPEWSLDEAAVKELRNRTEKILGREVVDAPPPGGLGYRGLLVQNPGKVEGIPPEFVVFRGVLSEPLRPESRHWSDLAGIEGWLLAQARDKGYGETLDALGVSSQELETQN